MFIKDFHLLGDISIHFDSCLTPSPLDKRCLSAAISVFTRRLHLPLPRCTFSLMAAGNHEDWRDWGCFWDWCWGRSLILAREKLCARWSRDLILSHAQSLKCLQSLSDQEASGTALLKSFFLLKAKLRDSLTDSSFLGMDCPAAVGKVARDAGGVQIGQLLALLPRSQIRSSLCQPCPSCSWQ